MVTDPPAGKVPGHSIADYRQGYETEHRLRGFRSGCGFVTATWGLLCPVCGDGLREAELVPRGRIAAVSVQTVPSEEFLNDAPYAYLVVDLDGGGRATGWIRGVGPDDPIAIGDPVELAESYRPGVQFRRAGGAPR